MTTPAKPERPDRMMSETFEQLGIDLLNTVDYATRNKLIARLWDEARRARSEEERLTRELAALAPQSSGRPARMTEAELHELETTPPTSLYAAQSEIEVLLEEIRAGHADEATLTGERARAISLMDKLAAEWATALTRWLGYREAAIRLVAELRSALQIPCGFAMDLGMLPQLRRTECVYCGEQAGMLEEKSAEFERWRQHAATCPKHPMRAVEAERDAAREEAEQLRRALERIRDMPSVLGQSTCDNMRAFATAQLRAHTEKRP